MDDFAAFIDGMPGLSDHARRLYILIDREAGRVGERLSAMHDPTALRERTGSRWLVASCRELADALERDARLAAIKSLRAWASRTGSAIPGSTGMSRC